MRHRKKVKKFGISSSYNKALLNNLATSLLKHKRIKTTLAKAKALRPFVEKLITKAKDNSVHSKRIVYKDIRDRKVLTELFNEISAKVANRPGGYTRIVKLGHRLGDGAEMAMIELVDYNDAINAQLKEKQEEKNQVAEQKDNTNE
ncbi:MAG TPA: 50S ribosomal protein L17 [Ignavibacteriales bacterium]|nr:50S ribosomal protein L17 [Ignavibacteriales bacterium]HOL80152.1 50S ribosomal protein L17 [Ignavibacteriales bacterium]HOM64434.1 50S ribosomal protein L17 [Ignavibacteriales bacterium]HPD67921.1 50S ribosomal protein L17 [Ignavibacteriales bacterium]HPP32341.1 50S ribosomal protein L17 [Ignavibacteriales bacterium]